MYRYSGARMQSFRRAAPHAPGVLQKEHNMNRITYALILAFAISGCDLEGHAPVSSAYAQPAGTMGWAEPGADAVADGTVFIYY